MDEYTERACAVIRDAALMTDEAKDRYISQMRGEMPADFDIETFKRLLIGPRDNG